MDAIARRGAAVDGRQAAADGDAAAEMLRAEGIAVGVTLVKEASPSGSGSGRRCSCRWCTSRAISPRWTSSRCSSTSTGKRRKAWMFVMRLMYSGRDFAWLYAAAGSGLLPRRPRARVRASRRGAAPDRLRQSQAGGGAGARRRRAGADARASWRSRRTTCSSRASLGRATGHDKGGVEARGKGDPLAAPRADPGGETSTRSAATLLARLTTRRRAARRSEGRTIAERFEEERGRMLPLPGARRFAPHADDARRSVAPRAGEGRGRASTRFWCDWAGLDVTAYVGVDDVEIVGPDGREVQHRGKRFGQRSVGLPALPAASWRASRRRCARSRPSCSPSSASRSRRAWRQLVDEHGPKQAARAFAKVLRRSSSGTARRSSPSGCSAGARARRAAAPGAAASRPPPA